MKTRLREYFEEHPKLKFIIYGGKGGLGKTTMSAATCYWLSKRGKKAIVFSTDPQASLTDIFEMDLFGKGETSISENMYALEVDADKKIADYQNEIREKIKSLYSLEQVPPEIEGYIKASAAEPAMAESATFDSMVELILGGKYDYYIFDMMPHGHAIRFLSMASLLNMWISKITGLRKEAERFGDIAAVMGGRIRETEDAMLRELEWIGSRLGFVSNVIMDEETCAFFYVLIPELMPILDTRRAMEVFKSFKIPIAGVIVNMVYPLELLRDPTVPMYIKNRIEMQQKYVKQIEREFGGMVMATVPMFDREPKGLDAIARVSEALFGG